MVRKNKGSLCERIKETKTLSELITILTNEIENLEERVRNLERLRHGK